MRTKRVIGIILLALSLATNVRAATPLFVDATPADNFKLYWLIKTDKPPVIDGKLDDAIWQQAEPLQGWGITDYGRPDGKLGDVDFRACWDDHYLYVGAKMYHQRQPRDMDELRRKIADVTEPIYNRECLEIHIDGKLDHATRFQSVVNALNEKMMIWYYDFGWGILENPNYGLDADWDTAAYIGKDYWSIEVRYALPDIQVQPRIGYQFGINPCWFNWADSRETTSNYWWQFETWSTPGASHHDPRLYGHFMLVDKKPANMETGLRLAYPDLDKRTIMIQTDTGFLVFRNGKKEEQSYLEKVNSEIQNARAEFKKVSDLFAESKTKPEAYVQKQIDDQDAALKKIETELAGKKDVALGQLNTCRADLGKINGTLDDMYWRAKQNILLSSLPAAGK